MKLNVKSIFLFLVGLLFFSACSNSQNQMMEAEQLGNNALTEEQAATESAQNFFEESAIEQPGQPPQASGTDIEPSPDVIDPLQEALGLEDAVLGMELLPAVNGNYLDETRCSSFISDAALLRCKEIVEKALGLQNLEYAVKAADSLEDCDQFPADSRFRRECEYQHTVIEPEEEIDDSGEVGQ